MRPNPLKWGNTSGLARVLHILGTVFLACSAHSQTDPAPIDPYSVPPDIFVTSEKQAGGADLVEVTAKSETYPPELLQRQCMAIGVAVGNTGRGFDMSRSAVAQGQGLVRCTFAVNGLTDRVSGAIQLEAIVDAFLGAPEPFTVKSILVQLGGETPLFRTLKEFRSKSVVVVGQQMQGPAGLEYRIVPLTQDPQALTIPRLAPDDEAKKASTQVKPRSTADPLVLTLLGTALVAAGALVYFALLRPDVPRSS